MILSQIELAGISPYAAPTTKIVGDPFYVYLQTIPFIFYSILTVYSVWFIVTQRISFGPMKLHETMAFEHGSLCATKEIPIEKIDTSDTTQGSVADLIIPISILIFGSIGGMLYAGGFTLFGGEYSLVEALKNNPSTNFVLLCASGAAFVVASCMALARRTITLSTVAKASFHGFDIIKSAVCMVILATVLGAMLKQDLLTGNYLASTLLGAMNVAFLPVIFYLMGLMVSVIIGSSWGSIMLLMPIAVPMLTSMSLHPESLPDTLIETSDLPQLLPLLGAIFSGSVSGDHVSPISATTMMAATSAGSYPEDHTKTQIYYALPAIIAAALMYLAAGFIAPHGMLITFIACLVLGGGVCTAMLRYAHKKARLQNL
jgi:Na+/H+ antiporter NhaC